MYAWEKIVRARVSSAGQTVDEAQAWLHSQGLVPAVLMVGSKQVDGPKSLADTCRRLKAEGVH